MKNYNGQEMTIRTTNQGKFQVLPVPCTPQDMSRAPVFATQVEAEAYIARPIPEWEVEETAKWTERMKYNRAYSTILSGPEMRKMRSEIQFRYERMMWESKKAADHQRAVGYAIGQTSVMGRDIAAVRQSGADYQASEADRAAQTWNDARHTYEVALQQTMHDAGIPIALFRSPVLIAD